jgi:hypothetical protein
VRRDIEVAQIVDEFVHIVSLVGAGTEHDRVGAMARRRLGPSRLARLLLLAPSGWSAVGGGVVAGAIVGAAVATRPAVVCAPPPAVVYALPPAVYAAPPPGYGPR